MPYVENEIIHDADSHIVELPDCLDDFIDPKLKARYHEKRQNEIEFKERVSPLLGTGVYEKIAAKHDDAEFRAAGEEKLHTRKLHEALGAFRKEDRPRALDLQGYASQLIFTSLCLRNFDFDLGNDMELCYGTARAHNRMMTDFCSVDRRLLPTAYIPIADMKMAADEAKIALDMGCKALMIPYIPPQTHSQAHIGLEPLWAIAQEACVPVVFHIAGTELLPGHKKTGRANAHDVVSGGDGSHNSLGLIAIPHPVMLTLSALIFDGVMDKFPKLKFGAIELGASWLPGWMHLMDSTVKAFGRHEERLRNLSALPSEIVRRQVRVTPYPSDDAGWIVANSGPEVCMYSSDYPHPEGGRNPLKHFRDSLDRANVDQKSRDGFFRDNFVDMMGEGLAADLRYPKHLVAA
jgi:predicted TIM-barrel fold metal-dependent hydrolase